MKKILVTAVVIGLVAGSLAAPAVAKKKKPKRVERVVETVYELPATGVGAPVGSGVCFGATNSCGRAAVGAGEKFVKVEITDASGLPVSFDLGQDTDPDAFGTEHDLGQFCGTTGDKPIEIVPGAEILVFPWMIGPSCASVGTTGTVTLTISNLP